MAVTVTVTDGPLRDGVRRLLRMVRREECTYHRALDPAERDHPGAEGSPEIRDLLWQASNARRHATAMLHAVATGGTVDGCTPPAGRAPRNWTEVHRDAHGAMAGLHAALTTVHDERLALNPGPSRSHPQYLWRDVTNLAVRGPLLTYAAWHHRAGRTFEALAVLSRWYEAVRGTDLPTKALSDASYDLACGLVRAGRLDEAMTYLPDAFTYNDRAAVGVLKAWARHDADLVPLSDRADFRALVGAA